MHDPAEMSSHGADIEAFRAEALAALKDASQTAPPVGDLIAQKVASDRSWVTRSVISVFLTLVVAVVGITAYRGVDPTVTTIIDFLKTFLLPVVTLILGFYFGQSSTSNDRVA